jgi:hypothetical protein
MDPEAELARILSALRAAEDETEEQAIGNEQLASLLFHHAPQILERVLTLAKRDNRVRRCLSAARYYTGLNDSTCARIDAVLHAPFPAAAQHKLRPRGRKR